VTAPVRPFTRAGEPYHWSVSFFLFVVIADAIAFFALRRFVRAGEVLLSVLVVLELTPIIALVILMVAEQGSFSRVFNPRYASWQFMGDGLTLTTGFGGLALAWTAMPHNWYDSRLWLVASLVIGYGLAAAYHAMEYQGYKAQDALINFTQRSKKWHDWGIWGTLVSAAIYNGWPVIRAIWTGVGDAQSVPYWWAIIGFGAWLLTGLADMLIHKPKAGDLHPAGRTFR
jgi:hypothetical protein